MRILWIQRDSGHVGLVFASLCGILLSGCVTTPAKPAIIYSDLAPHALPPTPTERMFDGSLYASGGLSDLASDAVALKTGDPVILRFDPKNGYPGVPQDRVTEITGQVVREEPPGNLIVSAQRTIRDGSGSRRIVLVGRVSRSMINPGNEISVSLVSMLRFRSDQPSDKEKSPGFRAPGAPGNRAGRTGKGTPGGTGAKGKVS
jgi:hypothetical protein